MFVDRVVIEVEGGSGGDGCMSFRREKYVPNGGPDGGDGGSGSNIIMVAEDGVDSLMAMSHIKHWRGQRGNNGGPANRTGKSAEDVIIKVPLGTVVIEADAGFVMKDLNVAGEQMIAARGGSGGRGNLSFKNSTNRAPRQSTPGGKGERRKLILELKSIADIGLIGKPNAGKSTLLSRLSRARPEIADYPFTTKFPNLGQVQIDYDRTFVLADIPGLIEGASEGVGLGHEFLRHVERAGILIHLVEPAPVDGTDPIENYQSIRHELMQYDADLAARPEILCVTKAELPEGKEVRDKLAEITGGEVLLISAVTGENLNVLLNRAGDELDRARQKAKS
ncbi:GTPase ObgE [Blastopirellula marina]|uniref:GTPase Obg n=1 Tax=Blastopirellula marina DSM 3645 TaxID=314230 RepID=A3ZSM1_9BACT|nr:GTPase ObgE [Blastopirellula marina]EAQ80485.1 GTP-binding protein OBG [Blastopirellula marina DSM 3645]